MAFIRSRRPTISITKAWREGTSSMLMVPVPNAAMMIIQYCACPVALTANSTNEGTMNSDWVASNTFRF